MDFKIPDIPLVVAHRGASAYAPENTLAAFKLAVRQGAEAVELDTKLTADGVVVVCHDTTVNRTTDHEGKVSSFTLEEIKGMDAGSHFDTAFRGEKIPTLREVLSTIEPPVLVNVEIANLLTPFDDSPARIAQVVRETKTEDRVFFSSFNPIALYRIHKLLPHSPIGMLAFQGVKGKPAIGFFARALGCYNLHAEQTDVTATLVEKEHGLGRRIFVYTVNQREEMKRLFELGVDGVITDDPVLGLRVRSSQG